ncbi:winged helix-turn-helix transcriptional regulator [Labrys monachus]|nr:helix-turn-helix domain-containing protein [Labrys monachus]
MEHQPFAEVQSARPVLDQIANKWSVLILTVLCPRPSRFNAIMRRLDGITHKALTEALRRLERNGLVNRRVIASSPVAVEYSITPLGLSLRAPFEALYAWASDHSPEILAAQRSYDERGGAEHPAREVGQTAACAPVGAR